jgi:hypothetical protein
MPKKYIRKRRRKPLEIEDPKRILALRQEGEHLRRELAQIRENADIYAVSRLSHAGGRGGERKDPIVEYAMKVTSLEEKIDKNMRKIIEELNRLERIIGGVQDPESRLILRLRIIEGKNWEVIGDEIHMHRTTVYRKFLRLMTL